MTILTQGSRGPGPPGAPWSQGYLFGPKYFFHHVPLQIPHIFAKEIKSKSPTVPVPGCGNLASGASGACRQLRVSAGSFHHAEKKNRAILNFSSYLCAFAVQEVQASSRFISLYLYLYLIQVLGNTISESLGQPIFQNCSGLRPCWTPWVGGHPQYFPI